MAGYIDLNVRTAFENIPKYSIAAFVIYRAKN